MAGFRIDAAHALTESYPDSPATPDNFYEFLGEIRSYTNQLNPSAVLLGDKLFSLLCQSAEGSLLTVCNLSGSRERGTLNKALRATPFMDVVGDASYGSAPSSLAVNGYGYRWIRFQNRVNL